jgi:hypothetical protein
LLPEFFHKNGVSHALLAPIVPALGSGTELAYWLLGHVPPAGAIVLLCVVALLPVEVGGLLLLFEKR